MMRFREGIVAEKRKVRCGLRVGAQTTKRACVDTGQEQQTRVVAESHGNTGAWWEREKRGRNALACKVMMMLAKAKANKSDGLDGGEEESG